MQHCWTEGFKQNNKRGRKSKSETPAKTNKFDLIVEKEGPFYVGEKILYCLLNKISWHMFGLGSGTDTHPSHNPDYDFIDYQHGVRIHKSTNGTDTCTQFVIRTQSHHHRFSQERLLLEKSKKFHAW
jgi:hypothetical protein